MSLDALDFKIEYFVNRKSTINWNIPEGILTTHNLMFVYEGKCSYFVNNKEYILTPGNVIYLPPGFTRKAYTYENHLMKCYAINFITMNGSGIISKEPLFLRPGMDKNLLLLFGQLNQYWILKDSNYQLKSRGLLMLIICKLLESDRNCFENIFDDIRIVKAKEYIAKNLTEEIKMGDIAMKFKMNPVYFGHLFYKCEGITLKKYINQKRIQLACELLEQGDSSIKEISYQCGYNDIYYFSKTFKSVIGISPSRYIKKGE